MTHPGHGPERRRSEGRVKHLVGVGISGRGLQCVDWMYRSSSGRESLQANRPGPGLE